MRGPITWDATVSLPQGMIYPHKAAPIILEIDNTRLVKLMNFSLVPSWSKVRKPKFATYNARIEEITNKPTWREPFKRNHCLVPIKYFIESVYEGPYAGHNIAIEDVNRELMTAAGIWDTWIDKDTGEILESFAILTCGPPKEILDAGHDRCPVFLTGKSWSKWLNAAESNFDKSPKDKVQFLLENRADIHFEFTQREALKSFKQ